MMVASSAVRKLSMARAFRRAYRNARTPDEISRRRSEEYLAQTLGQLKGLPQKVGQLLSMRASAQDEGPLASLSYAGFDPMPWTQVEGILEEEFEGSLAERFACVSHPPLAAASLSQVHAARLHDGREVVIKVQYPDIWKAVWSDLEILGWIGIPFRGFQKRFRLDEYRKLLLQTISQELDYGHELSSLRAFRTQATDLGFLEVPEPVAELCSSHVLTMTRIEGETLRHVASSWGSERRALLARRIAELFIHGLLGDGLLHADPHPGNYRFRDTPEGPTIVLYDFGCVRKLPAEFTRGLGRMLSALRNRSSCPWAETLVEMGFDGVQVRPLGDRLGAVMEALFAPFVHSGAFDVSSWHPSRDVERILGADRWALRTAAPPHFLFVMRGFHGILYYLRELGVAVDLSGVGRGLKTDEKVASSPLSVGEDRRGPRHLCVTVEENGEWKVRLFLPPERVRHLAEDMPSEVLERLRRQRIDIEGIEQRYRGLTELPCETVFDLRDESKAIRVWLE